MVKMVEKGTHPQLFFHDHNCSEIAIVLSGSAEHVAGLVNGNNNMRVPLSRGDVLILHPGCVHAYDKIGDFELCNVVYDRTGLIMPQLDGMMMPFFQKLFPQQAQELENMAHPVLHLNEEALEQARKIIEKIHSELCEPRPGALFASMTYYMQLIMFLSRYRNDSYVTRFAPPELRISNAISYMNSHFHQRKLSIDQIAIAANMSRRNFCRHFRASAGCAPGEYLLRLRLSQALQLLENTDAGQETIALKCGFSSSPHFSRIFTKFYGTAPSVFRNKNRKVRVDNVIKMPPLYRQ
jgi:AraC-like DNA-binding protein